MKKYFYLATGIIFLFSKTIQSQDTIQHNTVKETTTTTVQETPRLVKSDLDLCHGIFGVRFMPTISSIKAQTETNSFYIFCGKKTYKLIQDI